MNPIVACLAGGRNKLLASKAYESFNNQYSSFGISVRTPETVRDIAKEDIPFCINSKFGGHGVVKIPYSNAAQGVFTITNSFELDKFMQEETSEYDSYIVQSLIGNYNWSSNTHNGKYYHMGMIPDKKNNIYCADLRMMVHFDILSKSWRPLVVYSRRAEKPLTASLNSGDNNFNSWEMLGTNLSFKDEKGTWCTDTNRLLLVDNNEFNLLGIGIDELIDAFFQTVMASVAIDKLAAKLLESGKFDLELFQSLNKDSALESEFYRHNKEK